VDPWPYDESTAVRIAGTPRRRTVPRASAGRRTLGAGAVMTMIALGLQEVFDPRDRDEIILHVDLSGEPDDGQPVTLDYDPTSPSRSRAHVRPWLLTAS
jgi:hypothetical protein